MKLQLCDKAARIEKATLSLRNPPLKDMVSRLLYLFLLDFLSGVELELMYFKDKRQNYRSIRINWGAIIVFSWLMLICFDTIALGNTIKFALNSSTDSNYVWCITVALWTIVDAVFISTFITLWTHVLLPSRLFSRIKILKSLVVGQLVYYHDNSFVHDVFNAASHFFVSVRLASLLPNIHGDVKSALFSYSTVWPREHFRSQGVVPFGAEMSHFWNLIVKFCVLTNPYIYDVIITTIVSLLVGVAVLLEGVALLTRPVLGFTVLGIIGLVIIFVVFYGMYAGRNRSPVSPCELEWQTFYGKNTLEDVDENDCAVDNMGGTDFWSPHDDFFPDVVSSNAGNDENRLALKRIKADYDMYDFGLEEDPFYFENNQQLPSDFSTGEENKRENGQVLDFDNSYDRIVHSCSAESYQSSEQAKDENRIIVKNFNESATL